MYEKKYLTLKNESQRLKLKVEKIKRQNNNNNFNIVHPIYSVHFLIISSFFISLCTYISFNFSVANIFISILMMINVIFIFEVFQYRKITSCLESTKIHRFIKVLGMKHDKSYKKYVLEGNKKYNKIAKEIVKINKEIEKIETEAESYRKDLNYNKYIDTVIEMIYYNQIYYIEDVVLIDLNISKKTKKEILKSKIKAT